MSEERIICSSCNQNTPRNMHNKCIYCGAPYPEEHWFSDDETAQKIARLNQDNEDARQKLDESRKKEKEEADKRKRRNSSFIDGGL